jgi:serine phosphatase RsbU (regulator of sigma subunit)
MSITKSNDNNRRVPDGEPGSAAVRGRTQGLLHLPTWSRLRVASKQRALLGRGGDFFEVFQHRDDRVTTVMADVCGNGPGAAAHVSDIRWALRQHLARAEAPSAVLSAVNEWLVAHKGSDRFVTAVCARIDLRLGRAEIASAGHLGPFVKRASGAVESLATGAGLALGILPNQSYQQTDLDLFPEDAIVLATDGITDRLASPTDLLGERALLRRLAAAPHNIAHICDSLLGADALSGEDATVVVLQLPPRHRRATPVPAQPR